MAAPSLLMDLAYNQLSNDTVAFAVGWQEPIIEDELTIEMYRFIIASIRQEDSKNNFFLKRFLEGPQEVWEQIHNRIFELKDFWDISKVEDEFLQYTKNIVGWTGSVEKITDELDDDTLRRLISNSVALWKSRGPEDALSNILSLVTNAKSKILNWFDYRWVVDEKYLTEHRQGTDIHFVSLPGEPDNQEYYSNLRIVDNGSLNKTLVIDIVKLMRAVSERFIISYLAFLETFSIDDDKSFWVERTGTLVVSDGSGLMLNLPLDEEAYTTANLETWIDQVIYWKIRGRSPGTFGVEFKSTGETGDAYRIEIDISANTITLSKYISSVSTPISSVDYTAWGVLTNAVWIALRVEIVSPYIKVFVNSDLITSVEDSTITGAGTLGFWHTSGSLIEVDEIEMFLLPMETDEVTIDETVELWVYHTFNSGDATEEDLLAHMQSTYGKGDTINNNEVADWLTTNFSGEYDSWSINTSAPTEPPGVPPGPHIITLTSTQTPSFSLTRCQIIGVG